MNDLFAGQLLFRVFCLFVLNNGRKKLRYGNSEAQKKKNCLFYKFIGLEQISDFYRQLTYANLNVKQLIQISLFHFLTRFQMMIITHIYCIHIYIILKQEGRNRKSDSTSLLVKHLLNL